MDKNSKKIIGLDLDGVIIDHGSNIVEVARMFGIRLRVFDTAIDILREKVGKDIYRKINNLVFDDPEILSTAPIFDGVEEGLDKIRASNQQYFLISRQKNPPLAVSNLKAKGLWNKYFNESNSFFLEEIEGKNIMTKKLGVTIYLDDQLRVLNQLEVEKKFLFDPLGNYQIGGLDYVVVSSWLEFIQSIDL